MGKARRLKHLFGGAMRQAGIVAAAGVYALDHHVDRLADDHRRAKRLALGLAEAGLAVDPDRTETNFVQLDVAPLTKQEAMALLAEQGIGLSATIHPTVLRAVTHLDVTDEEIDGALEAIPRALGARVGA
jgi:threonine aldolase